MKLKNSVIASFDCRQYKKDTPRTARTMVEAGGRINLTCAMDEAQIPEECKEFARKSSKNEKFYLTFKVFPKNCKLYTASAKQVEFPAFEKIDGGRFDVNIDFSIKHGTGTELNGLYANAVQIIRRADNPFDAVEGGDDDFATGSNEMSTFEVTDEGNDHGNSTQTGTPAGTIDPQSGLPF